MARLTLILGGARSGKSRHGETLARATGLGLTYIATARPWDSEMRARIALHQERRAGQGWHECEAPVGLAEAILAQAAPGRILLVDCLTLWLTNLMTEDRDVAAASRSLLQALVDAPGKAILVSNETGLGIVPDNAMARRFRDLAGCLHQHIAAQAESVLLMVAGLPLVVKSTDVAGLGDPGDGRDAGP